MFMRDFGATLLRRWYLTAAGVLGTLAFCLIAMQTFPATYEAKANILLLPPQTSVEAGGNPYLQLGDLTQVVDVMVRALSSQSAVENIASTGQGGTYEVTPDYTTSSPIFIIAAADKTPEATLSTLQAVSDSVGPTLKNLQDSLAIAPPSQINASVLTSDDQPEIVRKTQLRVLIVALVAGLLISALLIAVIDSFLRRREAGRSIEPLSSEAMAPQPSGAADGGSRRNKRLGLSSPAASSRPMVERADEPAGGRRPR